MKYKDALYRRLNIVSKSISAIFIILILILFKIQILDHDGLSQMTDMQNKMILSSQKVRGNILDRNGIPLTMGKDTLYITAVPKIIAGQEHILEILEILTDKDIEEIKSLLDSDSKTIEMEVVNRDYQLVEEIEKEIYPGLYIFLKNRRYDENSVARHVVGYIQGDGIGIMGIEKSFNSFLSSDEECMIYALKDAKNQLVPGAGYDYKKPDTIYYDVELTIDFHIQRALEQVLDRAGGRNGGVVVDIRNGHILALASMPNYKQYDIRGNSEEDCFWAVPLKAFPPGSVFKTIVAAVALEDGGYSRDDIFYCNGGIDINGVYYSCHKSIGGLGRLTLKEAFAHSCNDTFISIAREIGGDKIVDLAMKFGFASAVDIELDNDNGLLPDKSKYAGAGIGNLALGQGDVMVTPIQIVDMMTTIGNNGVRKPLRLVKGLISNDGRVIEWNNKGVEYRVITEETARELREWLVYVTEHGTGKNAYSGEFGGSGGKTGTPQITNDRYTKHYGWFAGFFPIEDPQYAIAILSREEGEGGMTAAPIFKEIAHEIWKYNLNLKNIE